MVSYIKEISGTAVSDKEYIRLVGVLKGSDLGSPESITDHVRTFAENAVRAEIDSMNSYASVFPLDVLTAKRRMEARQTLIQKEADKEIISNDMVRGATNISVNNTYKGVPMIGGSQNPLTQDSKYNASKYRQGGN